MYNDHELKCIRIIFKVVADEEGFEPSVSLRLHALSRGADSANSPTRPGGEIIMDLP